MTAEFYMKVSVEWTNFMYYEFWIFFSSNGLNKITPTYQGTEEHGNENDYV